MIFNRVIFISFFIGVFYILIVARLFNLQVLQHEKYNYQALVQQGKEAFIPAERGTIRDREGVVLVYSKSAFSYYTYPKYLDENNKIKISENFAEFVELNKDSLFNILSSSKGEYVLAKNVSVTDAEKLGAKYLVGVIEKPEYIRVYPYGSLAAHVLGFATQDKGLAGIESEADEFIKGIPGFLSAENDALGKTVSIIESKSYQPEKGDDVFLTINLMYQKIIEQEIKSAVNKNGASSAIGLAVNPNTGEILALYNYPDFNPEQYNKFSESDLKNRILTDTYEPGSTIKPIVMSLMLEKKLVSENEIINTENGSYKYKGILIKDTKPFKSLSVKNIIVYSSNIGMVKLSSRIKNRDFYEHLRKFGFGTATLIDLPGESEGMLKEIGNYSKVSKAFISHGYEIASTPLQLVMAYSALINGGILYKPFITKEIVSSNGVVKIQNKPFKVRRVIEEETSYRIKDFLLEVIEKGSGINAKIENFRLGGKTGTTQVLESGEYSDKRNRTSFIGFFPFDNPEVVLFVMFNSPKVGVYGGEVSAPVFRSITKRIIEEDVKIEEDPVREIDKRFKKLKLADTKESFENEQNSVNTYKIFDEGVNKRRIPNLIGMSKREALRILNELNIDYVIKGSGFVKKQNATPGTSVDEIKNFEITCNSGV